MLIEVSGNGTVSAIIEAERFRAQHAVMLAHSFDERNTGFDDFSAFARLFELEAAVGKLLSAQGRKDPELHLAWVQGQTGPLAVTA